MHLLAFIVLLCVLHLKVVKEDTHISTSGDDHHVTLLAEYGFPFSG